jgi:hypothetical protein
MANYDTPKVYTLGTVQELTALSADELDKVGSSADALTEIAAALGLGNITGDIQPDA